MSMNDLSTSKNTTVAVFDFDGTISDRHTFWRYLRFIAKPHVFWPSLLPLGLTITNVVRKKTTLMDGRVAFIERFLGGMPIETEKKYAADFIAGPLKDWIRPEAVRRLKWHQAKGHKTILVSNAPENYLVPWGQSMGFDHICGSRLEVVDQRLTGRIDGKNCVDDEKVRRLREHLGDLNDFFIYAYGDSTGDHALLEVADRPFYKNWYK
ncbi:HAD family hydrolase [Aquirhabdus sp.]|uniref:HAD family hydrolase n=1 Tax=Aquirhabdus sp. TaxID=2824160 RepID=UPI00396C6AFD